MYSGTRSRCRIDIAQRIVLRPRLYNDIYRGTPVFNDTWLLR